MADNIEDFTVISQNGLAFCLPDKEFRYLRTVIVTAAVYWGFGSKLLRLAANNLFP